MEVLGVANTISILKLLIPADEDDILGSVPVQSLISSLLEASVADVPEKEKQEAPEFLNKNIFTNVYNVLDSIAMMTEVDHEIGRAQSVPAFAIDQGHAPISN